MRKWLGIAVAGAALAAGMVGGVGFAVPGPGAGLIKCANFEKRIGILSGQASVAAANGNQARADAINARIAALVVKKTNAGC
jgi:hypothetical protein